ncbi:hypothetical protein [Terrisporobacter mayombei]|uniref:DUF4352 domain-containing protein n=1 Tax=Terrisporobacter mayombei TaxID=1541 RepID=A0ABY9Q6G3_9FIRM|nr:hypothetical protein [Terrisporobacter mayombei]MCC3869217.1 hypothetical protein [Terrisporobacter mayombei]WMT82645.1 hypothetical protein TEMA_31330 [Terrisporobacter mayombei]
MNKKFIKVSLIICIPLILLIGFFTLLPNSDNYSDEWENDIEITYKDCKEKKYNHVVSIIVKNNSKNIASLGEMKLSFDYNYEDIAEKNLGEFYIRGYEKDAWDDNKVMGIDPGKEEEIIFKIPKGIKIDKDYYNLNRIIIDYDVSFYKFRTSPNRLFIGAGQMGGSITLGEKY